MITAATAASARTRRAPIPRRTRAGVRGAMGTVGTVGSFASEEFGRIRHKTLARLKPGRNDQQRGESCPERGPLPWRTSQKRMAASGDFGSRQRPAFHLYLEVMTEIADTFDSAFTKAVDLGNRIADKDKDADLWDIADGLLAGALQYWLYSRQPCGEPALSGLHAHQHRPGTHG